MVQYANKLSRPEIIRMWKTVFNDSDEFMEMYFRLKYKDENTLIKIQDGKVAASLQMLPYSITFYGNVLPIAYISGAATLPEERKKGYMEELLAASFSEMKKRNIPITTLIPQEDWLFGFYEKYGYTPMFDMRKERIILPLNETTTEFIHEATINDVSLIANHYNNILNKQNLTVQKTNADWQAVFEDHYLSNGKILYWKDNQEVKGVAFVSNEENEIIVKGILTDNEAIKLQLFAKIAQLYHTKELSIITPASGENTKPLGMARIIDAEKILTMYASANPSLAFSIRVEDKQLQENNQLFRIKNGVCSVSTEKENPNFEVSINLLTQLLFGYRINTLSENFHIFTESNPQMNLMME